MSRSMVFKRLHCALTIALLVLVIVGGFIFYYEHSRPAERLYSEKQLTPQTWLYITQVDEGGAAVGFVYRYYLNTHSERPMKLIADSTPFMISDQSNAVITTVGDRVMIRVTGTIFSFTNSAFFYDGSTPVGVMIDLNATAARRYGS